MRVLWCHLGGFVSGRSFWILDSKLKPHHYQEVGNVKQWFRFCLVGLEGGHVALNLSCIQTSVLLDRLCCWISICSYLWNTTFWLENDDWCFLCESLQMVLGQSRSSSTSSPVPSIIWLCVLASYRKTITPFVFLNILSLWTKMRVENYPVQLEHIIRWR